MNGRPKRGRRLKTSPHQCDARALLSGTACRRGFFGARRRKATFPTPPPAQSLAGISFLRKDGRGIHASTVCYPGTWQHAKRRARIYTLFIFSYGVCSLVLGGHPPHLVNQDVCGIVGLVRPAKHGGQHDSLAPGASSSSSQEGLRAAPHVMCVV